MIKLSTLLLENIEQEVSAFERLLTIKYTKYLEQFHFYYDNSNNSIFLTDIYIRPNYKGKGFGTKIMKELTQFADSKKLPIVLIPISDSLKPNSGRRLVGFYRRFGFIENNGNILFDDMGMYRLPK